MLSDTLGRLNDAEILLAQATVNSNDFPIFRANINAFVSAGRSVTFVMEKEFAHVNGFAAWYETKRADMKKDPIFDLFVKIRNNSVKERAVARSMRITTTFDKPFTMSGGGEYTIPIGRFGDRGIIIDNATPITHDGKPVTDVKAITRTAAFFDEKPDVDALDLCHEYLNKLKVIVAECYSKFPK